MENNKHSKLSVGDWVTFLTSERDVGFNTVLNFGAVLIAFVGLALSSKAAVSWQAILETIIIILFSVFAFYKVINPFGKRASDSEKILKRIISGELSNSDDIKDAWINRKTVKK